MKPWCAEGDVPAAANLRGRSSHVGWHSDDKPLFGKRGEAKLIVSVSFGTQAPFKWKGKSCPINDGHSCWLGHGDILVMDGQCLVHPGGASFASHPPCVYKVWVSKICLLLDKP